MPEVRNVFLKGKMNKDVNPRLLQTNEYIDARNISINDSIGGNSGLAENVNGNTLLTNFGLSDDSLEITGMCIDSANDRIIACLTNWNDTSSDGISNFASTSSSHYICMYDNNEDASYILVTGSFLNFSKTKQVINMHVLEDLLFISDDRNQPRKINIKTAKANPSYYFKEEHISVAKYYPFKPAKVAKLTGDGDLLINSELLITTNQNNLTTGTYTSISPSATSGSGVSASFTVEVIANAVTEVKVTGVGSNYSIGDTITIAGTDLGGSINDVVVTILMENMKHEPTMKDCVSETLPASVTATAAANLTLTPGGGGTVFITTGINSNWKGAQITANNIDVSNNVIVQPAYAGSANLALKNNGSSIVSISIGDTIVVGANPDYNASYDGDSDFLSDKFIRLSYRFKYDDGEYSVIAPFTQHVFIPKQDGYFIDETFPTDVTTDGSDENKAIKSTIIAFFENKVNCTQLVIDLPEDVLTPANLYSELKVTDIDILYKESDGISIKVLDTITKDELAGQTNEYQYLYQYNGSSPVRVLPDKEVSRASDKAPLRAKAQEISGNRVMYGNYIARSSRPSRLNYNVLSGNKEDFGVSNSINELQYPNHSLKQNRSYKVGVVLCDKFGRQSDVITSDNSIVYNPYRTSTTDFITSTDTWFGDSIKIVWNNIIPSEISESGYVGLYSATNPLGWYSYKVVVQQKEQDYYNIFLPTILNNFPATTPTTSDEVAHVTLFSDNINKAPRDLREVGAQDITYSSSVDLYGRVHNTNYSTTRSSNIQYFPDSIPDKLVKIGVRDDIGLGTTESGDPYDVSPFYSIPTGPSGATGYGAEIKGANPFIGQVSTRKSIGATGGSGTNVTYNTTRLNVYETAPFYSEIDIFYETSTSGLISDLNTYILNSASEFQPASISDWSFELKEDAIPSSDVTPAWFDVVNTEGVSLASASLVGQLLSVKNGVNADVTNKFVLEQDSGTFKFKVKIASNSYFTYTSGSNYSDNYKFTFSFTNTNSGVNYTSSFIIDYPNLLDNVEPTFTGSSPFNAGNKNEVPTPVGQWNDIIYLDGQNGSAIPTTTYKKLGLIWEITSVLFYWPHIGTYANYQSGTPISEYLRIANTAFQTYTNIAETLQYDDSFVCVNTNATNSADLYNNYFARTDTDFRVNLRLKDASGGTGSLNTTARVDFTLKRTD